MGLLALNTKFYFRRTFSDIVAVGMMFCLPMALIVMNSVFGEPPMVNGFNVDASSTSPFFLLVFQFFGGTMVIYYLFEDFKTDMRWRLYVAPCSQIGFLTSVIIVNWIITLTMGAAIVIVSSLFLDTYWGNPFVLILTLLQISLMGVLICVILFLFVKKKGAAIGVLYVFAFGTMIVTNLTFILEPDVLGDGFLNTFLFQYNSPTTIGMRAIVYSGSMDAYLFGGRFVGNMSQAFTNLGILGIINALLLVVIGVAGRRRKSDNF